MRILDFEHNNFENLPAQTRAVLDAAEQSIEFAYKFLEVATNTCPANVSRPLQLVLLSLGTECARRYRAIVALCELCQINNAEILSRSLFETMLAGKFIITEVPRIAIKLPAWPDGWDPMEFRGLLYTVAPAIKAARAVNRIEAVQGANCAIPPEERAHIRASAQSARQRIGDDWADAIHETLSFTGIRGIDRLAEYCGLLDAYVMAYPLDSQPVHGGDALRNLRFDATSTFIGVGGSADGLGERAAIPAQYLGLVLMDIDALFGLGHRAEIHSVLERPAVILLGK